MLKAASTALPGLIVTVFMFGCSGDSPERASSLFEEGMASALSGDHAGALESATKLAESEYGGAYSAVLEGLILENKLQYFDALYHYYMAAEVDPEFAEAHAGLYRVYRAFDDAEMASRAAADLSTLRPDDAVAATILAEAMLGIGQPPRARVTIDKAQDAGLDGVVADLFRARTYRSEVRIDSAAALEKRAFDDWKASPEALMQAARLMEETGRVDSAIILSHRAVEMAPRSPLITREHFHRALEHNYGWESRWLIRNLTDAGAGEATCLMMQFIWEVERGDRSEVNRIRPKLAIALEGETNMSLLYDALGQVPGGDDRPVVDAIEIIRSRMRETWPEKLKYYGDYILATRLVEHMEAKTSQRALSSIRPPMSNRPDVKAKLVWQEHRIGMNEEAAELVETLDRYHSTSPKWQTALGEVMASHTYRRWEDAAGYYRRSLELDSLYRPAVESWLDMLAHNRKWGQAAALVEAYPALKAQWPILRARQAEYLALSGEPNRAIATFGEAIPSIRGNLPLWTALIEALSKSGRTDELKQVLVLASELAEGNPDILMIAASIASDLDDYARARDLTDQALAIEADNAEAAAEKARALYWLGEKDEAFALFKETHTREKMNERNSFWYSRLLARDERELDFALNTARQAMFNRADNLRTWLNYSYVLFQAGRLDMAAGVARNVSQRYPDHPLPPFRRGLALYWNEDRTDDLEAREYLRTAIELGLSGEELKEAEDILSRI